MLAVIEESKQLSINSNKDTTILVKDCEQNDGIESLEESKGRPTALRGGLRGLR